MTYELKILKATLMLRKLGNTYSTKEEQREEFTEWFKGRDEELENWINEMREELKKTPEQREREAEQMAREMAELEARQAAQEIESLRPYRDEWTDLWDDRARDCGAIW